MKRLIERGVLGGRFLYFPTLGLDGKQEGALFLIYLPGELHGVAGSLCSGQAFQWTQSQRWIENIVIKVDDGGVTLQPDFKIRPKPRNRDKNANGDPNPNDRDTNSGDIPFSRLVFELEYANRNIIDIRKHGKSIFDNSNNYTRLFLTCKLSKILGDSTFRAAMVLWRKDDQNAIVMDRAISFGTRDLHGDTKTAWARGPNEGRPLATYLPHVPRRAWERPADANLAPTLSQDNLDLQVQNGNHDPNEWTLTLPAESLLYRVSGNFGGNWEHYTDHLNENAFQGGDMTINLLKIARNVYDETPLGEAAN